MRDYTAHDTISHCLTVEEDGWTIEAEADIDICIIHEGMVRYYRDGSGYPGFHMVEVSDVRSITVEGASHSNRLIDWIVKNADDLPRWIRNWVNRKMEAIVEPAVWEAEINA